MRAIEQVLTDLKWTMHGGHPMRRDKMSSSRHGDAQTGADARPDRTGPRSVGPMKLVPSLVIALLLFLAGAPGVGVSPARSHEAPPAKETVIRPGETLERALAKVGVSRAEARNVVSAWLPFKYAPSQTRGA